MTEQDKRLSDREKCYAKLVLREDCLPAYIRDVSNLGFRIEIPGDVSLEVGDRMNAKVIPVEETEGLAFGALLEVRWIRDEAPFTAVGMKLIDLDSDQARVEYNRLIEYYDMNIRD